MARSNENAWTYLASNDPVLFRLDPDATLEDVIEAICTDRQASTNSTADSTYRLADAYYGWSFHTYLRRFSTPRRAVPPEAVEVSYRLIADREFFGSHSQCAVPAERG